ncbi:MAG: hypothetical protein FJZ01_06025 [Candidatus Sericytochromatia bacterium]|nr:hypothetical protein [Candidatus Tanganyikabacteria bacterium]
MSRIACVEVQDFALAALLRAMPELSGLPVGIVQGAGTHATIRHASPEAQAGGVLPGLGVARARQRLPELKALPPSEDAERSARATLLEVAFAFSPQVADGGPGSLYLDISGMQGLFNSDAAIATSLDAALARVGLPCRIGVGANKTVARVAARASEGVVVVPPGDEARFLDPLPIAVLAPSADLHERLEAWGVHRVGQLARLSERSVTRRLGAEGVALRRLALGADELPFVTLVPPRQFEETVSFDDWVVDNLEPLLQVLGELVDRLLERLRTRGLAAQSLVATLALDPRGHDVRHVEFAAPLTDRRAVLDLLRHDLAARPPRAAVAGARAVALPAAPQAVQGHLFAPADPTPERLAVTLARLCALVGAGRVGAPARPAGAPATLAIALLRPPAPISVECVRGRPAVVVLDGESQPVRRAAGPWHLREGWWTADPTCRDDFDVELADGRLIRIYRDLRTDAWLWDGVYG